MSDTVITTDQQQHSYFTSLNSQSILIPSVYIQEIDSWVSKIPEDASINTPLLISGTSGCGKSTLITKWIEYYTQSYAHSSKLLLIHYVGISNTTPSYFSMMYQISNTIKKTYNFTTKLEYTNEKIKIFFDQWLEKADLEHQSAESNRKMLVLIIDGLEKFKNEQESFDWLPTTAPKTIRLIYTCNRDSDVYKYLKNKKNTEINAEYPDSKNKFAVTLYFSRCFRNDVSDVIVKDIKKYGIYQNALYLKFLFLSLHKVEVPLPKIKIPSLESFRTVQSLFEYVLEVFSGSSTDPDEIYKLFAYLSVTSTGLSEEELITVLKKPVHVFEYLKFFDFIIYKNGIQYYLSSNCFKYVIFSKFYPKQEFLHAEICEVIDSLSPHKIPDILFHIYKSKDWMKLKNYVSQVFIFAEMFKPENKIDLFRYWKKLEKIKFDLIECYNKSLENFVNVNQLPPRDLCILLVYFSVFFKEYADFEIYNPCRFKRPVLIGYHELKEIDLLDEFISLGGIYEQKFLTKSEEKLSTENVISRERFKEKVLKELKSKVYTVKSKEYYSYKRWLWIQFPWCALDVHSNFSQILKIINEDMDKHRKILIDSVNRIIKNSNLNYQDFKFKSYKLHKSVINNLTRSCSSIKAKKNSIFRIPERPNPYSIIEESLNQANRDRTQKINPPQNINSLEISHSLSFQGLKPENSLEHMQKNFLAFSKVKISSKINESHILQKILNKKAYEYKLKKTKLERISSQIDYSNTEILAQERSRQKITTLQEKLKDMCKKLNKIEGEAARYVQIIDSCFKNPARNDEWERKLNRKIDYLNKIIDFETKNIENYDKDHENLQTQLTEFQSTTDEKLKSQHTTLNRVLEQFLMKSKINEELINHDALRLKIINATYIPQVNSIKYNFKEQKQILTELKEFKGYLKAKNKEYDIIMNKLNQVGDVKELNDLPFIILRLNDREELNKSLEKVQDKLERLENERKSLASKLEYLKKQEEQYVFFNYNEKIEHLGSMMKEAEKRVENFMMLSTSQDIVLSTCKGIFEKMWKKLEIVSNFSFEPEGYIKMLNMIAERMVHIEKGQFDLHEGDKLSLRSLSPENLSTLISTCDGNVLIT
ncbi:hypothetical protein SteCoe_8732 [Stentor coeruleus]|uniref:Nephrocystin 3-like N-terminal domain-containing protein n=1 Tax=Stentor coeruleus TaxID=5963 RepID=A0A1R2CJH3_9CILI|nr:hypothetical protein SteCoe_8732 [Stentor coeruleus]